MGVQDGRAALGKAMKELWLRWSEAQSQWNDSVARNFEKERLRPLESDMRSATSAMESMAAKLQMVRRDVQ